MPNVVTGVAAEAVFDVVRFPLWWYSQGLVAASRFARDFVVGYERSLALSVWLKNIFVPMFGQHDWQSRIISVFMRVVNIIGRGLALVFLVLAALLGLAAYLALPIVATIFALYHGIGALMAYYG